MAQAIPEVREVPNCGRAVAHVRGSYVPSFPVPDRIAPRNLNAYVQAGD